jgi:UDP-N-acetylmuramoyl-tripeptide--D-alanyl-D-alanine ligase
VLNPLRIFYTHIYLLQLENYQLGRFIKVASRFPLGLRSKARKKLVLTAKLMIVSSLAIVLYLAAAVLPVAVNGWGVVFFSVVALVVGAPLFFIFLSVATLILLPLDLFIKWFIIHRAQEKLGRLSNIRVIAVAGSYGKTTTKEVIASVIGTKYSVLKTPETINTPLGIARLILSKLTRYHEVFIVEFGEHKPGDISELCKLVEPDIVVLTGINEAHLERMGSMEKSVAALFEVVQGLDKDGMVLLNADDENIRKHYKEYVGDKSVVWYGTFSESDAQPTDMQFMDKDLAWKFKIKTRLEEVGPFMVPILGSYIGSTVAAAVVIAKRLGVVSEDIELGVKTLRPVEHRLQPIFGASNVLIIDDSYNGNPSGVKEAVSLLSKFTDRRKIYVTPGLVELGVESERVHKEIGRLLANTVDMVIFIKNSATGIIAQTMLSEGFVQSNIIWFDTAEHAHQELSSILQGGDVVLFQNDWPDNYL